MWQTLLEREGEETKVQSSPRRMEDNASKREDRNRLPILHVQIDDRVYPVDYAMWR
jgi:hypothetical protein